MLNFRQYYLNIDDILVLSAPSNRPLAAILPPKTGSVALPPAILHGDPILLIRSLDILPHFSTENPF